MRLIVVDKHESQSARAVMKRLRALEEEGEIVLEIRPLQVADYLVGTHYIERKKVADFVTSILDGRLWRQAKNISFASIDYDMTPVFLIEGSLNYILRSKHFRDFNPASFIGAWDSLQKDYEVQVVHAQNSFFTVLWLLRFAKDPTKRDAAHAIRKASKSSWPHDLKARYILEGFQKIGGVRSTRLLEKYRDLGTIFKYAKGRYYQDETVPKELKEIHEMLWYKYGSEK